MVRFLRKQCPKITDREIARQLATRRPGFKGPGDYVERQFNGRDALNRTKPQGNDIHAHHILPQNGPAETRELLRQTQNLLEQFEIDPFGGQENLAWAPNKPPLWSADYVREVARRITEAANRGGRDAIIQELKNIGQAAATNGKL